jgi:hypothetical protein
MESMHAPPRSSMLRKESSSLGSDLDLGGGTIGNRVTSGLGSSYGSVHSVIRPQATALQGEEGSAVTRLSSDIPETISPGVFDYGDMEK